MLQARIATFGARHGVSSVRWAVPAPTVHILSRYLRQAGRDDGSAGITAQSLVALDAEASITRQRSHQLVAAASRLPPEVLCSRSSGGAAADDHLPERGFRLAAVRANQAASGWLLSRNEHGIEIRPSVPHAD